MKLFFTLTVLFLGLNAYALDSVMKFTVEELNENEVIARSGVDVATAMRILQLQLRETGCYQPSVNCSQRFEKRTDYTFNIESENCIAISSSSSCEAGYSPRNLKANPNKPDDKIVGANKYIICIKAGADTARPKSGAH